MTAAQDRITLEGQILRDVLKENPVVRRHVEEAFRRGYSQGVFNCRQAKALGTDFDRWIKTVFDWRFNLKFHREISPGVWQLPPDCGGAPK